MKGNCKVMKYSALGVSLFCLLMIFPLFYGCAKTEQPDSLPVQPGDRIIQFAGYDWEVRSGEATKQGPGPNYFSDKEQNVWVDAAGRLHLKITQRQGNWYAAGVMLKKVYGYKKYIFQIDRPLSPLDKNVVGAVFLYKNDNQEMDVELSKWGQEVNDNSQYVIQPGDKTGNKKRFNDLSEGTSGVQIIDWQKDRTIFSTYKGLMADTGVATHQICFWEYSGTDHPTDQDMRVKINLWLFKGLAPSGQEDQELVISGFKIQ